MALGLRGKPEGAGRGFECNVCIYTRENSCLNKAGRGQTEPAPGLDQLWRELGLPGGWEGDRGTEEERSSDGSTGPGSDPQPQGTPGMSPAAGSGPPLPLLAPPALSPQAKPQLSAQLMGLGGLMLTNKRAQPNARD